MLFISGAIMSASTEEMHFSSVSVRVRGWNWFPYGCSTRSLSDTGRRFPGPVTPPSATTVARFPPQRIDYLIKFSMEITMWPARLVDIIGAARDAAATKTTRRRRRSGSSTDAARGPAVISSAPKPRSVSPYLAEITGGAGRGRCLRRWTGEGPQGFRRVCRTLITARRRAALG